MKKRFAATALFLCLAVIAAHAQTQTETHLDPPKADSPQIVRPHRRVLDGKFLVFAGLQLGATIADIETTQWALGSHSQAYEANPIFGRRPDRPRAYGIGISLTGLQLFLQYRSKERAERNGKRRNLWIVGASANTGLHTVLAVHNARIAEESVCPAAGAGCR
jgi:hypothetical protein